MTNYMNKFVRRKIDELKDEYGGKCWNCGSTSNLQFAHIKETELNGRSRGRKERLYDVMKHPDCYALLCSGETGKSGCHEMYDSGVLELSKFFDLTKISKKHGLDQK